MLSFLKFKRSASVFLFLFVFIFSVVLTFDLTLGEENLTIGENGNSFFEDETNESDLNDSSQILVDNLDEINESDLNDSSQILVDDLDEINESDLNDSSQILVDDLDEINESDLNDSSQLLVDDIKRVVLSDYELVFLEENLIDSRVKIVSRNRVADGFVVRVEVDNYWAEFFYDKSLINYENFLKDDIARFLKDLVVSFEVVDDNSLDVSNEVEFVSLRDLN